MDRRDPVVGHFGRGDRPHFAEAADAFAPAGGLQEEAVEGDVPGPVEPVFGEGTGEGRAVDLFGLGERSIDVEDQRGEGHRGFPIGEGLGDPSRVRWGGGA